MKWVSKYINKSSHKPWILQVKYWINYQIDNFSSQFSAAKMVADASTQLLHSFDGLLL